jgi:gamma-glutamyl-gamma-aminobutyrate hydrolase PuuD
MQKIIISLTMIIAILGAKEVQTPKKLFDELTTTKKELTQSSGICMLPPNKILRIGCTKRCNNHYVSALKEVAKELHYSIKVTTLKQNRRMNYKKLPSQIDAILSPGGHDIDPKYYTKNLSTKEKNRVNKQFKKYGKSNKKGLNRDRFEFTLFQHYFKDNSYKNIPVLGICYGTQMLAAVKGIPLYVDIPTNIKIPARRRINDKIYMNKKSTLFPYINRQSFKGYKNHHQAIDLKYYNSHKRKFSDTLITATSNGGKIAEVIEFTNRPAIGVQFHPERSNKKIKHAVIKKFLSDACRKVKLENQP